MENSLTFHANERDTRFTSFIDASSFFAVEATGDSEVDVDPNVAISHIADDDDDDDGDDDDDAESSSCDVSDHSRVTEFNDNSRENVEASHVNVVDDDEEDRQELVSGGTQVDQKSCVSLDSTNETMNEMDKNRLFWETCLAS